MFILSLAHNKIFGIEILLHQFGTQISGHDILYYKDCFLDVMHCEKCYGYMFQSLFISVVASSITVKKGLGYFNHILVNSVAFQCVCDS